jgi:hypothetical protein
MMRTLLAILMTMLSISGMSQDFELDTKEVLDVIKKWNFAVNAQSEETLRELYADRMIYYAKERSGDDCIEAKNAFFRANPSFKQKIVTDPSFVPHTAGVIKANFVREVFEIGRWRKVPTYLLISYERNGYKITGESDLETDKKAKYTLKIGRPMDLPQSKRTESETLIEKESQVESVSEKVITQKPTLQDTLSPGDTADAVTTATGDSTTNGFPNEADDSTFMSSVTEEVLSDEAVSIPKKYVYVFIGLLVIAAIVLFSRRQKKNTGKNGKGASVAVRETTLLRNDKAFENFVIALFDPHYFLIKNFTRQRVYAGNTNSVDFNPNLEVEFQNKDARVGIAIECIFIPQLASRHILSYSASQINRYHDFEEGTGMEVYIIVGLEGEASDPKELFLIPASDLREGHLGYQELQPFRKHGMFFYNSAKRRLL